MRRLLWFALLLAPVAAQPPEGAPRYAVKQVIPGSVYLNAGSAAGLREGMNLTLKRRAPGAARLSEQPVAEIIVVSVALQSSLCDIRSQTMPPQPGDEAELSLPDAISIERIRLAEGRRRYAQVVRFSEVDPLEEEIREYVPHAPLSEEGHLRARIGFEMTAIFDRRQSNASSNQEGVVIRTDWTRINHTYWNLTGYWRGRISSARAGRPETLTDLLSRTYHLGLFYNNPRSPYQIGLGRLLLPWASSLSTLDGGYVARRVSRTVTAGLFAGTTPDPTQWNYDPRRQMIGLFAAFEQGSFDHLRWTSTIGAALTRIRWRPERQFIFIENALYAGSRFSILHNLEADARNARLFNGASGPQLSRSFLTVRLQPSRLLTLDFNHNHFRGLPTFDERLIATGLLDRLLFQGFSAGVRLQPIRHLSLYGSWGRSHRESDATPSLNQMYSASWSPLPFVSGRIEARFNRFDSSFGRGSYRSLGYNRDFLENLRVDVQFGEQDFQSLFSAQSGALFLNSQLEWNISRRYFLTGGFTAYRGQIQNYDQLLFTLGYRLE